MLNTPKQSWLTIPPRAAQTIRDEGQRFGQTTQLVIDTPLTTLGPTTDCPVLAGFGGKLPFSIRPHTSHPATDRRHRKRTWDGRDRSLVGIPPGLRHLPRLQRLGHPSSEETRAGTSEIDAGRYGRTGGEAVRTLAPRLRPKPKALGMEAGPTALSRGARRASMTASGYRSDLHAQGHVERPQTKL